MAGRLCQICSDAELAKRAGELIAQRLPDIAIAEQLGLSGHAGRMAVSRHRRRHVEAPAQALAAAANKGRAVAEQRKEIVAASERGDPLDYIKVESVLGDIKRVGERLEKNAEEASRAGQRLAVASLSSQQLRQSEVRLKAAGVGGYGAAKTQVAIGIGAAPFKPFVLRLNLQGRTKTLVLAPEDAPDFEVLDAQTERPFDEHDGAAIITRGEDSTHDLLIVPRGHPVSPVIEHDAAIEQAVAADPAPDNAEPVNGEADADEIIAAVFDKRSPENPPVEPTEKPPAD